MTPLELIRHVARGYVVGHTGRLREILRHEMINACREVCDREGLSYSQKDLNIVRADNPRYSQVRHTVVRSKVTRSNGKAPKRYAAVERLLAEPGQPTVRPAGVAGRQDRNAGPGDPQAES